MEVPLGETRRIYFLPEEVFIINKGVVGGRASKIANFETFLKLKSGTGTFLATCY